MEREVRFPLGRHPGTRSNFAEVHAGAARTGDKIESMCCTVDTNGLGDSLGVELVIYKEEDGVKHILRPQGPRSSPVTEGDIYHYELKDHR